MRRIVLVSMCAIALAGCAGIQNTYDTVTGASVSPTAVYIAANSFDVLEASATNYLRLPKCNGTKPVCRSSAATKQIIPAVRSGRYARDHLRRFAMDNPGRLGPVGLYNALTTANQTLQLIYQQYGVTQ